VGRKFLTAHWYSSIFFHIDMYSLRACLSCLQWKAVSRQYPYEAWRRTCSCIMQRYPSQGDVEVSDEGICHQIHVARKAKGILSSNLPWRGSNRTYTQNSEHSPITTSTALYSTYRNCSKYASLHCLAILWLLVLCVVAACNWSQPSHLPVDSDLHLGVRL
jgi:hypothetical protein